MRSKKIEVAKETWFVPSWTRGAIELVKNQSAPQVYVIENQNSLVEKIISARALTWQTEKSKQAHQEVIQFMSAEGPVWILNFQAQKQAKGAFAKSRTLWYRDQVGSLLAFFKAYQLSSVSFDFSNCDKAAIKHAVIGLNLAGYQFRQLWPTHQQKNNALSLSFKSQLNKSVVSQAIEAGELEAEAINLARHLVNLPPNVLNPITLSEQMKSLFVNSPTLKYEIWDEKKLAQERMHLHLAVGQGSKTPSRLIKISYRPKLGKKIAPVAFVGKGVTFDTGGLDIKPSSAMRLMKKDMGGAATVLALAHFVNQSKVKVPVDFYVGLAENSVDANSFRPSDIIKARNGLQIEIHNTDAEGRLVLADALDLAATAPEKPRAIINVATLTGAIKVALGSEIAGLFCNDKKLSQKLFECSEVSGDLAWPMPLHSSYLSSFNSPFADMVNATEGFGGAITAALFLEKFVQEIPWAHFDIYSWSDKASGALSQAGGSGQGVSLLMQYLSSQG